MSTTPITMADKGSPQVINRYSERYKSLLMDSPPRDSLRVTGVLRNSPLQPNRTEEYKIFEGEKYSSFEIKNEDRGEWRQKIAMNITDEDVNKVEITQANQPKRQLHDGQHIMNSPQETTKQEVTHKEVAKNETTAQTQGETRQEKTKRAVPRYMQATTSFEKKVDSASERRNRINLGPRSKGGIFKRVGTSKIPRYQSTTHINAIEDIRSEMTVEDTYISMAARIKLFEKGLGNGSNRPSSSTSLPSSNNQGKRSPSVLSRTSSPSRSQGIPNYTRKTVSSETKERAIKDEVMSRSSSSSSISQQTTRMNQERKLNSQTGKSFKEKLNLWQGIENNKQGLKRKNELAHEKRSR